MANETALKLLVEESAVLVSCTSQSWVGSRTLARRWTKIRDRDMEEVVKFLDTYSSVTNKEPTSFVENPMAGHETYPGTWAHQTATMSKSNPDGESLVGVSQTLQEVFPIAAIADLAALNRRRVKDDKREAEFDFQDGRADDITLVFPFLLPDAATETACMSAISEADLLTLAPAGYIFFQRQWQVDTEAHVAEFTVKFKAVTWNVWGHTGGVEDYREYSNAGATNASERMTRTWVNIRNADVPAAVEALRAGTTTPDEYRLRSINVANHGNGACTISVQEGRVDLQGYGDGYEVLRPFGWPECIGLRETQYIEFTGFKGKADLLAVAEPPDDPVPSPIVPTGAAVPPAGFTYTGHEGGTDGDGLYGRKYTYEKVTWSNVGPTVFKTVGEQNTQGNDIIQTKQACALPQGQVVAAFAAIAADAGYVLTSKGINPVGNGEFSLTAAQEIVYAGTTAAGALLVELSIVGNVNTGSRGLQRVWFRRTAAAKETLIGSGGVARLPVTFEGVVYDHVSVNVTDHHDGAYTVSQTLRNGYDRWWWGSRYDREDEYLAHRDRVLVRISGGVDARAWATRSRYEKIFASDDTITVGEGEDEEDFDGGEAAWQWAVANVDAGGGVFDDATGEALIGIDTCFVDYKGNDVWVGSYTNYAVDA